MAHKGAKYLVAVMLTIMSALMISGCAGMKSPPQYVDAMSLLGVSVPQEAATNSMAKFKGKPIVLVVGPNMKAFAEHMKSFREEMGESKLMTGVYGGTELLDLGTDVYGKSVAPMVSMLKGQFSEIKISPSLGEAASSNAPVVVVVDSMIEYVGSGVSRWWARFDFIAPGSAKSVYRTVSSSVDRACPGTLLGAETAHRCWNEAEGEMLKNLQRRLDDAMVSK